MNNTIRVEIKDTDFYKLRGQAPDELLLRRFKEAGIPINDLNDITQGTIRYFRPPEKYYVVYEWMPHQ